MQMMLVLSLLIGTLRILTRMQTCHLITNIWFRNNLLHINLKTHYLEFRNIKQCKIKGQIHYNHNYITNATHI